MSSIVFARIVQGCIRRADGRYGQEGLDKSNHVSTYEGRNIRSFLLSIRAKICILWRDRALSVLVEST